MALAATDFGLVVLAEAGLSFLGIGLPPTSVSWGQTIATGKEYLSTAWWISAFPGLVLALLVVHVGLLGDQFNSFFNRRDAAASLPAHHAAAPRAATSKGALMRAIPSRRLTRLTAAAAALAVSATAACSTTSGGGDEGAKAGGTLTVASPYPTQSLDPHGAAGAATGTQIAGQAIFSRLVRAKADGQFTGDLATTWDVDPQATTWTFTLRDGVKFSDGSPADSQDVVASFKRIVDLKGPNAANFAGVDAKADGPTKVVLTAPKPEPGAAGQAHAAVHHAQRRHRAVVHQAGRLRPVPGRHVHAGAEPGAAAEPRLLRRRTRSWSGSSCG